MSLVSVVVPIYNTEKYLAETVAHGNLYREERKDESEGTGCSLFPDCLYVDI